VPAGLVASRFVPAVLAAVVNPPVVATLLATVLLPPPTPEVRVAGAPLVVVSALAPPAAVLGSESESEPAPAQPMVGWQTTHAANQSWRRVGLAEMAPATLGLPLPVDRSPTLRGDLHLHQRPVDGQRCVARALAFVVEDGDDAAVGVLERQRVAATHANANGSDVDVLSDMAEHVVVGRDLERTGPHVDGEQGVLRPGAYLVQIEALVVEHHVPGAVDVHATLDPTLEQAPRFQRVGMVVGSHR